MDGNIVVNAWKSIDKHMFTLVLGANMQDNKEDNKSFSATGFLSDKLTNLDFAMQYREGAKPRGSVSQDRLIGFFANASYAYDNRICSIFLIGQTVLPNSVRKTGLLLSGRQVSDGIFITRNSGEIRSG